MRERFDILAKQIISTALESAGRVEAERQVVGPAQSVDIWFRPDPALAANLTAAGLLGRMGAEPCIIEPFRNTPGLTELQGCIGKQHALAHETALTAKRSSEPRPGRPRLWVVSTGRPDTVLQAYDFEPMPDWPTGCYRARPEIWNLHLVVAHELPVTRDTLLMRLLGRGPTFRRAAGELDALPDSAWEKQLVQPLLVAFVVEISQNQEVDMEAREYLREVRARYAEWEKRVRREGREEGRAEGEELGRLEGERILLRKLLTRRFGDLPTAILARLDQATSEQLELWGERVLTAETLDAVFIDD